jgi:hypothetical protein
MSDSSQPGATELKELMRRVLESHAAEEFEHFTIRQFALRDMAPRADDAVLEGVAESPDGGAAMAEAYMASLPEDERDDLVERAAREAGRRLHSAAYTLLAAGGAAHLGLEITPEMVALAAVTELGDSIPV